MNRMPAWSFLEASTASTPVSIEIVWRFGVSAAPAVCRTPDVLPEAMLGSAFPTQIEFERLAFGIV
jgi:hypothetical protein